MKATKIGKCVVCRAKVTEVREFLPQISMLAPVPEGITAEMAKQIIKWRDIPILCAADKLKYDVRVVKTPPIAK
jgi:hypothetical protein